MDIDIREYKRAVEDFIYLKRRIRINIVFDNPMMMHRHFQMLCMAYDYVQQNKHK
jgi:hypothetical protein